MSKTYISFYLNAYRIHVHVDSLRRIGSPQIICFLIGEDSNALALAPYPKKDFHSHRVPKEVYSGEGGMEISSLPLCCLLAHKHRWSMNCSYRVPGEVIQESKVILFDLREAEIIEPPKKGISE